MGIPTTIRDGLRVYNVWAGNPKGRPENVAHCIEEVRGEGRWPSFHQCLRPRGHGPDGLYCKQHDPDAVAARRAAADRRSRQASRKSAMEWGGPRFLQALRQIANGHNDPRSLALEIVSDFDKSHPEEPPHA